MELTHLLGRTDKKPTNGSSTVINEMKKPQQGDVIETDSGD